MKHVTFHLFVLCLLVCTGLALDCDWDQSVEEDQGLRGHDDGWLELGLVQYVKDLDECQAACCHNKDCDLALVGYPQDGEPQCTLVKCWIQNQDRCFLQHSTQFKVFRMMPEGRVAPELGSTEPRNEINNVRCRLPMKVGSCRAAFPRFYYDVTNQSCRSFSYGGCKGNGNNFDTQEDCEATCSGVTGSVLPDESTPAPPPLPVKAARMAPAENTEMSAEDFAERCGAEPEAGPCRAAFRHWYYNSETGDCQSFIYGGCKGNKNNYDSHKSCVAACKGVTVLPSSKKVAADDDGSTEHRDHCMAKPDPGPCRAAFPMFYYDPMSDSCQSFIYGGCRGNKNQYSSIEECMNHCGATGWFISRGRAQNRWTAGLFLFITLAAISALMLAALVVIVLRRHSLSRRASSVSDKQELLPDPDDQTSVESLTLPESPKLNKA